MCLTGRGTMALLFKRVCRMRKNAMLFNVIQRNVQHNADCRLPFRVQRCSVAVVQRRAPSPTELMIFPRRYAIELSELLVTIPPRRVRT